MFWFIVIGLVVALLVLAAVSDRRDRRAGFRVRRASEIGDDLRASKRATRQEYKAASERAKESRRVARKHRPAR